MEHGGNRKGAGRKSKADEQILIEKLEPLEPAALAALKEGLNDEQAWAVKLFMEYRYGKPKQIVEQINIDGGQVVKPKEWI